MDLADRFPDQDAAFSESGRRRLLPDLLGAAVVAAMIDVAIAIVTRASQSS